MTRRMFTWILVAVVAVSLSGAGSMILASPGQTAGPAFVCTKCKIGSDQAGKCPLCGADMKPAGKYACPSCDMISDKPGTCACGKTLVKTEMAGKKCPACGHWIAKDAKSCPICDKAKTEAKS